MSDTPTPSQAAEKAIREEMPALNQAHILPYSAIRYVAGYPESYVKDYARAYAEDLRAERDNYRQLFNATKLGHEQAFAQCQHLSGLLRRCLTQLSQWQRKYGEHNPAWLPPSGDVQLAEDIDAALAADGKDGAR